ncbi:MAG: hypothetical protein D6712_03695 [Chloroflexi bacterium]|nr:MAG: hypothetical protein D6712_03695 [Chloroflexota bacterium]
MKRKLLHLLWAVSVSLVMVAPALGEPVVAVDRVELPGYVLAQSSSSVTVDINTLLNLGTFILMLALVVFLVLRGNPAGAADARLANALRQDMENRDSMKLKEELHQLRQQQSALYKMAWDGVLGVVTLLAPVTKTIKADDALRDWMRDIEKPGKPTVGEVDDEFLKPVPPPADNNPHRDLPPFTAVNRNPDLAGEPTVEYNPPAPVEGQDQRILARPPFYGLIYQANAVPWVHHKENGYEFSIEWLKGTFGLSQPGVEVYPGGGYLLKAVVEVDENFVDPNNDFAMCASIALNGKITTLNPHTLVKGKFEYIWGVEFVTAGVVQLNIFIRAEWAARGGKIIFEQIRLETLPENSGYTTQIVG